MNEQSPGPVDRIEPRLAQSAPADPGASAKAPPADPAWERAVLEKLVLATVTEQRRARRWSIFFRLTGLALLLLLVAAGMGWLGPRDGSVSGRHTAMIELDGVIEAGGEISSDTVNESLRAAFRDPGTAGVVLRINSPGGSPVQAGLINDEIRRLRAKHPAVPVYAVIEEICASGGYYVAVAADRIFVDKASLVGSIGVLIDGFGFTGAMDKVGVERRLFTAGANKGFLDPFSPVSDEQREHVTRMLGKVHEQFIETVRQGRGDRLKESPGLFSGLVWTGATAVEMGLADQLGSVGSVARDVIKAEEVVDFTQRRSLAERLAKRAGMSAGEVIARRLGAAGAGWALR